jgi:hypothetical protein
MITYHLVRISVAVSCLALGTCGLVHAVKFWAFLLGVPAVTNFASVEWLYYAVAVLHAPHCVLHGIKTLGSASVLGRAWTTATAAVWFLYGLIGSYHTFVFWLGVGSGFHAELHVVSTFDPFYYGVGFLLGCRNIYRGIEVFCRAGGR